MEVEFKKAVRVQRKFRGAFMGPSGSGKTMTALYIMRGLVGKEGKILVGDTERDSAALYADQTEFTHGSIKDFSYETFLGFISKAAKEKFDGVIIDSVSHAWEGFLEMHEQEAARARNSFTAWNKITPLYNQLIQAIVSYPGHIIVTMRSKTEYVIEKNDKGKDAPRKVGLAPVMRPGSEYEFDVVANIDLDHNFMIEKTRISFLDGKVIKKPKSDLGEKIAKWLSEGAEVVTARQEAPVIATDKKPDVSMAQVLDKKELKANNEVAQQVFGDDNISLTTAESYVYNLAPKFKDVDAKKYNERFDWCKSQGGKPLGNHIWAFDKAIKVFAEYQIESDELVEQGVAA